MEKRLQEAQLYKEKGNQRYREGKYRDAVSRYHRALLQLRGLDPSLPSPIPNLGPQSPALTPEQENILHTTQTDCYNNLAGKNREEGWVSLQAGTRKSVNIWKNTDGLFCCHLVILP